MKRIGLAASKMAKGNLILYNSYVILISFLFSLFIFVIVGAAVIFALVIISYVGEEVMAYNFKKDWTSVLSVCMVSLTLIMTLFNLLAISMNMKFRKQFKKP